VRVTRKGTTAKLGAIRGEGASGKRAESAGACLAVKSGCLEPNEIRKSIRPSRGDSRALGTHIRLSEAADDNVQSCTEITM
jgi:hypothetical protein